MLNTQEIADYINERLSALGSYKFNIRAEVGEPIANAINGTIRTKPSKTQPIANYVEVEYAYDVELAVPSGRTNKKVLDVAMTIGKFIKECNGKEITFGEGKATLSIDASAPEKWQSVSNIGNNVPLYFSIKAVYSESGVSSAIKKWFLDDMEIPYMEESVLLSKEGITRKIAKDKYEKTLMTGQVRQYHFVMPYANNDLCNMLQRDILNSDFKKQYTLKYYDGVSFTESEPFTTKVSIFATGNTNSKRPQVARLDITFADVDDGNTETKYYMALIDNPFDNQTEDTRWFDSQAEQVAYYNDKVAIGADYEQIKAPNLNSIDLTNQIYENTHEYDLFDLVNKNYAIIKVERVKDGTTIYDYFYYFVNSSEIGADNQVSYDLSLDSVQTYFFNPDIEFGDCFIEKACLNRFVQDPLNEYDVEFDATPTSKLFQREDINSAPKIMTHKTRININNTGVEELDEWLNENVIGWLYLYIQPAPADGYTILGKKSYPKQIYYENGRAMGFIANEGDSIPNPIRVLSVPIFTDGRLSIQFADKNNHDNYYRCSVDSVADIINGYADYIYAYKFSVYPPLFDNFNFSVGRNPNLPRDIVIYCDKNSNNDLEIKNPVFEDRTLLYIICSTSGLSKCVINVCYNKQSIETKPFNTYTQTKFYKYDITGQPNVREGAKKDKIFNPKLLSQDFKELTISDSSGNGYNYDLQKLNGNLTGLLLSESLTPDFSKRYVRIKTFDENNTLYNKLYEQNLVGFIGNNDTTMTIISDAYKSMLANNKNFYAQNQYNRQTAYERSKQNEKYTRMQNASNQVMNTASGLASGQSKVELAIGIGRYATNELVDVARQEYNRATDYNISLMQENFTIDNLRAAPDSVKGASGNIIFEGMCMPFGIYAEIYEALENDKEKANDVMVKYGFNVNIIGKLKDYVNIRKYFNYIRAQIQDIQGIAISNVARANIRNRFSNGIRFWKSDNISYENENYETWLESMHTRLPNVEGYRVKYNGNDIELQTSEGYKNFIARFSGDIEIIPNAGKTIRNITINTYGTGDTYIIEGNTIKYKDIGDMTINFEII